MLNRLLPPPPLNRRAALRQLVLPAAWPAARAASRLGWPACPPPGLR
jgi:hypothetical protein